MNNREHTDIVLATRVHRNSFLHETMERFFARSCFRRNSEVFRTGQIGEKSLFESTPDLQE